MSYMGDFFPESNRIRSSDLLLAEDWKGLPLGNENLGGENLVLELFLHMLTF